MQGLDRLNFLIDQAKAIYGSDNKLAQALGKSRQQISNWRHGHADPGIEVQSQLAEIAGLDVGEVVAAAAIEKTGSEAAIAWLEKMQEKIRKLLVSNFQKRPENRHWNTAHA